MSQRKLLNEIGWLIINSSDMETIEEVQELKENLEVAKETDIHLPRYGGLIDKTILGEAAYYNPPPFPTNAFVVPTSSMPIEPERPMPVRIKEGEGLPKEQERDQLLIDNICWLLKGRVK